MTHTAKPSWPFPQGHRRYGEPKEPSVAAVWRMLTDERGIPAPTPKQINLKCMIENTPSNMEYTILSAEKALDKAVSDAKIEVESFVSVTTQRLGVQSLQRLGELANGVEQGAIQSIDLAK